MDRGVSQDNEYTGKQDMMPVGVKHAPVKSKSSLTKAHLQVLNKRESIKNDNGIAPKITTLMMDQNKLNNNRTNQLNSINPQVNVRSYDYGEANPQQRQMSLGNDQ